MLNLMKSYAVKHIVITLPKNFRWAEYAKELQAVANGQSVLNFLLPSLPKESAVGCRCYLSYQGRLVGYMHITGLVVREAFECATTGNYWKAGPYVQRSGPFFFFRHPPLLKGFQGFHYHPESYEQETFDESHSGYSTHCPGHSWYHTPEAEEAFFAQT